jgi:surface protein
MKKTIAWILVLVLLSVASVLGTMAYLMDEATADNVMTVGKVDIELLEYQRVDTEYKDADKIVEEFVDGKPLLPAVVEKGFSYDFSDSDTAHVKWDHDEEGNAIKADYTSPIWDPTKISNEVDKMVFVRNNGDFGAYVRLFFAFEAGNFDTFYKFEKNVHINLNDNQDEWVWEWIPILAEINGEKYFVAKATYQEELVPKAITEISLSQIALDSGVDNEDTEAFGDDYHVWVNVQGIQADGFEDPDTALDEGFGDDVPFADIVFETGIDLKTALHNLNGDTTKSITAKVANVTFGLNATHPEIADNYPATFTSDEQNVPVYTYYVPNATDPNKYDVYVLADNKIYTPKNSMGLFRGMSALTTVDTSNMDVSRTENMYTMFYNCTQLTSIDVSKWNTENVTNMGWMFGECSNLTSLDVSGWDVSNVTTMAYTFKGAGSLTALYVSDWNVGKVTDMEGMFESCQKLSYVDVSGWDVSNVTNMYIMFQKCYALTEVDVSSWDVSRVTDMGFMFFKCLAFTTLDLSGWNTSNVTNMKQMFWDCACLKTIYVGDGWDVSNVTDSTNMVEWLYVIEGGNGTGYDHGNPNDKTYARVDTAEAPGYFTYKKYVPATPEA